MHMHAQALMGSSPAAAGMLPQHPQRVLGKDTQIPADPSLPQPALIHEARELTRTAPRLTTCHRQATS